MYERVRRWLRYALETAAYVYALPVLARALGLRLERVPALDAATTHATLALARMHGGGGTVLEYAAAGLALPTLVACFLVRSLLLPIQLGAALLTAGAGLEPRAASLVALLGAAAFAPFGSGSGRSLRSAYVYAALAVCMLT